MRTPSKRNKFPNFAFCFLPFAVSKPFSTSLFGEHWKSINKKKSGTRKERNIKMFAAGFSGSIVWTLKIRAGARRVKKVSAAHAVVRKGKFNCDRLLWGLAAPRKFHQGDNAWLLVLEKMWNHLWACALNQSKSASSRKFDDSGFHGVCTKKKLKSSLSWRKRHQGNEDGGFYIIIPPVPNFSWVLMPSSPFRVKWVSIMWPSPSNPRVIQ